MKFRIRRDTTAGWSNLNPVLANGEVAVELMAAGVKKLKVGDGVTAWNDLGYASGGEKGDKGDQGNQGNQGIAGPAFTESVVPITVAGTSPMTATLNTPGPSPALQANTMYFVDGFNAAIIGGAVPGAVMLVLGTGYDTLAPLNKVVYVSVFVFNDSTEDVLPDMDFVSIVGPSPVVAPGGFAILNLAFINKGGAQAAYGTWVGV